MKYFIKTFGCQMNFSDSQRITTFLKSKTFSAAKNIQEANLVIFNTCGVRQTAEDRVYGLIHNLRLKSPACFIVVTGCLSHRKDVQRKLKDKADLFLSISELPTLLEKLPHTKLPTSSNTLQAKAHYLCIQPTYEYAATAFVPIMTGCNNFCSYCVVPYARGKEWSRPMLDIVTEINTLSQNGCQEVTLLGQNVNSYNYEIPFEANTKKRASLVTFPLLLDLLAPKYPHLTFKFLTSHPKDFSEELVDVIAKNKNIHKELHLPIQSGSDRILKAMNRPYTQEHYLSLIEMAKSKIPKVRFSTDVIVGFPGETEEDFQQTVSVFKKVNYFEAYINKYSPRPGTAASQLENDIPWAEKKKREKILRANL